MISQLVNWNILKVLRANNFYTLKLLIALQEYIIVLL